MTDAVIPLRIFIASGDDLTEHVEVVDWVIDAINSTHNYSGRVKLISYTYAGKAPLSSGQFVADNYLLHPSDADIVISIVWLTIGSPLVNLIDQTTGKPFQSHFEYEFLSAYRANQRSGKPVILIYRYLNKQLTVDSSKFEKWEQVEAFFRRFEPGGDLKGFITSVTDLQDLQRRVEQDLRHLADYFVERLSIDSVNPARPKRIVFLPDNLPTTYVERKTAIDALRKWILGGVESVQISGVTTLHGQAGLGKTILARAMCEDPAIVGAFGDGILWVTLGEEPDIVLHQRNWIHALGGIPSAASSIESGKVELRRLLEDKSMLLVIDDLWDPHHLDAFRVAGPKSRLLITTRDSENARDSAVFELDVMSMDESEKLLSRSARTIELSSSLRKTIAEKLGYLPLALELVGAMLADGIQWLDIDEALNEGDLSYIVHGDDSVVRAIDASFAHLDDKEKQYFRDLAVFPPDTVIPEDILADYWKHRANLPARKSRALLQRFKSRSLVQRDGSLHDLIFVYLRETTPIEHLVLTNRAFVELFLDGGAWTSLLETDSVYIWQYIAYHLHYGNMDIELAQLLRNSSFLMKKIGTLGAASVLLDFEFIETSGELQKLAGVISYSAHILNQRPNQLFNQLKGRLLTAFRFSNKPVLLSPSLRLVSSSLTPIERQSLATFKGHAGAVTGCAILDDGNTVITSSKDNSLRVWDLRAESTIHIVEGYGTDYRYCDVSSDNKILVACSVDGKVYVWSVQNFALENILSGHSGAVNRCCLSSDGRYVVTASDDRTARLWDLTTGLELITYKKHKGAVNGCAIIQDGTLVATASSDKSVLVWRLSDGETVHVLEGHEDSVRSCAFSHDGNYLVSASRDKSARLWSVHDGRYLLTFKGHKGAVVDCKFSPDDHSIATASWDRTVRVWNRNDGSTIHGFVGHRGAVSSVVFDKFGTTVISGGWDSSAIQWDLESSELTTKLSGYANNIRGCTIAPDGLLAATAQDDGNIRIWDTRSHSVSFELEGHSDFVRACKFTSDGRFLVSASEDNTLILWDVFNREAIRRFYGHTGYVRGCDITSDNTRLVSGAWDHTIRVWDINTGEPLRVLNHHAGPINTCKISPDGKFVVSGSWDGTLMVWDMNNGNEPILVLKGHTDHIRGCAFHPRGTSILSASTDSTLRLWDATTGEELRVYKGHRDAIRNCCFAEYGKYAISVSDDNTTRLWDIDTGFEIDQFIGDGAATCCDYNEVANLLIVGDTLSKLHFLNLQ